MVRHLNFPQIIFIICKLNSAWVSWQNKKNNCHLLMFISLLFVQATHFIQLPPTRVTQYIFFNLSWYPCWIKLTDDSNALWKLSDASPSFKWDHKASLFLVVASSNILFISDLIFSSNWVTLPPTPLSSQYNSLSLLCTTNRFGE